jgi:hypothetical protein
LCNTHIFVVPTNKSLGLSWTFNFRLEDFKVSANQNQELHMVAIF